MEIVKLMDIARNDRNDTNTSELTQQMLTLTAFLFRTGGSFNEQVVPPLVLPKLPSRMYVRFGKAVSLEGLDKSDRAACQETYEHVKVWYLSLYCLCTVIVCLLILFAC